MKKKIQTLLSFIFFSIILISFTSCKKDNKYKFKNDIDIYFNETIDLNDLTIESSYDYYQYDNYVLKLDFSLTITNNTNKEYKFNISSPKAFGNDLLLKEEILNKYDYNDKSLNEIFNKTKFSIKENEYKELNFLLIIKDGNPECKYELDFKINNVNLNLHSYIDGYELDKFLYVHNPLYYSKVLDDVEYDINAVFGFKPNTTGSLKLYADYDWSDINASKTFKENRIKYIEEGDKLIKELENKLRNEGKTIEEIAKGCSNLRNQIRMDQYKDDPEGLELLKQRNLEKYGHEEGPLPEELYEKYKSWEMVLEKSYSTNAGMDACCGVYDLYFNMYTEMAY